MKEILHQSNPGFGSHGEDMPEHIDLIRMLVKNKAATFFFRVGDTGMSEGFLNKEDILIVDRSRDVHDNCMAVCFLDGEFTLKKIKMENGKTTLISANDNSGTQKPVIITKNSQSPVWGVVTYVIKKM